MTKNINGYASIFTVLASSNNGQIMNNYYLHNIIKLLLFCFAVQRSRTLLNCLRKTPSKSTSCRPEPSINGFGYIMTI